MQIITGKYRARKLIGVDSDLTRPTLARVKESIFNLIQGEITGKVILDLFAGSGSFGAECISRGAKKADFCDSSREAAEIVIKNAKKTRLFDKCKVSSFDYKKMIKKVAGFEKYDIVFIDPPYKNGAVASVLECILKADILNEGAFIVCESVEEDIFATKEYLLESFEVQKKAKYSISYVTVLRPKFGE